MGDDKILEYLPCRRWEMVLALSGGGRSPRNPKGDRRKTEKVSWETGDHCF